MAILEKIRKRTFFLILVIGLALFAFVISGLFETRGTQVPTEIGKVNGDEIPYNTFRVQVENTLNNMGRNQNISTMYIVNMLWQQAVQNKILDQQFEKLGISIGKDQIFTALAQSPAIAQDPQFQNENGVFDTTKFAQFIANLRDTNPSAFRQWQMQEESLAESAKRQMYLSLIRAGLGATATEGEMAYHQEADKVDVKYVTLPYTSIADSLVKISDSQISDYIKKNKKEYEQKEARNIRFVLVKEEASEQDRNDILEGLKQVNAPVVRYNASKQRNDTIAGFVAISKSEISDFVNKNSDIPYDSVYVTKDKLPVAVADDLYKLSANEIYGPYEDQGYYKLTKMLEKTSNAEVRASHILIAYKGTLPGNETITRTKEEAQKKAQSVLAEARKLGADFTKLAKENSDDASNANNGGDLNFFKRGTMVKPFNDYVFSAKVGDIGLVETNFGFHIIRVTDQKDGVKLATIARIIEPSEKTREEAFAKASTFEIQASEQPTEFNTIADKEGLSVLPAENLEQMTDNIFGLGTNRPIVQWAFNKDTKVGNVQRFEVKEGYVIAQLTKKIEKGLASVDDVRSVVTPILVKEEKAKQLAEKIKGKTLQQIVEEVKQPVKEAQGLTIKSPILLGVGMEPKVIGTAFGLALNTLSEPIYGENGVYVIEVTRREIAPTLPNYSSYTNTLGMIKMSRASQDLFSALEEASDIEDNRNLFY